MIGKGAHSIDLRENEHIIKEVRRNMFVFFMRVTALFILAAVGLVAIPFATVFLAQLGVAKPHIVIIVLYLLFLLILIILFAFRWTDYYLDVWVITNQRIFDIEQQGAFDRDISVFEIARIQDVNVKIQGMFATFLHFGNVHVHTAGENRNIIIRDATDPLAVKKLILEQYARITNGRETPPVVTPAEEKEK